MSFYLKSAAFFTYSIQSELAITHLNITEKLATTNLWVFSAKILFNKRSRFAITVVLSTFLYAYQLFLYSEFRLTHALQEMYILTKVRAASLRQTENAIRICYALTIGTFI